MPIGSRIVNTEIDDAGAPEGEADVVALNERRKAARRAASEREKAERAAKREAIQRRKSNAAAAARLVAAGLYLVPVDPERKLPIWGAFQYADDDNRLEAVRARLAYVERKERDGKEPSPHLGCTRDPVKIKAALAENPDLIFGIPGGPNRLVIIDCDRHKDSEDGVEAFEKLFADAGKPMPDVPATMTQSGGAHFYFADPAGEYGNHEGALGKGVNVRGVGGFVVAPGMIRPDGRSYTPQGDVTLVERLTLGDPLPELPAIVVERIKAGRSAAPTKATAERREHDPVETADKEAETSTWARLIVEARNEGLLPDVNGATLAELRAHQPDLFAAYDSGLNDASDGRLEVARTLMRTKRNATCFDLAALLPILPGCGKHEPGTHGAGSGTYSDRSIARDWHRVTREERTVTGAAFGAVDDDEDEDEPAARKKKAKRNALTFETFDEAVASMADDDGTFLVEDFLDPAGMTVLYGPSGSGKSFFALGLGFAIASGTPFAGRETTQGLVVYVASEGGRRFNRRIAALRAINPDVTDVPLVVVKAAIDLHGNEDRKRVIDLVRAAEDATGHKVALVVVDTLARALGAGSENDGADMGRLVNNGDAIRAATGAHLLYVHHAGKDAARGARGHSSLRAATDTEIEVTADKRTGVHKAEVTKQRDFEEAIDFTFRLRGVVVGEPAEGEAIKSAVAEIGAATNTRAAPDRPAVPQGPKLSPKEKDTLAGFTATAESTGSNPTDALLRLPEVLAAINDDEAACGIEEPKRMTADALRSYARRLVEKGVLLRVRGGVYRLKPAGEITAEAFGAVDDEGGET